MGNGGAATGGGTNPGGVGGAGINITGQATIKNCSVSYTGSGGSGSPQGIGGNGIAATGNNSTISHCTVTSVNSNGGLTSGTGLNGSIGISVGAGVINLIEDCSVNRGFSDGFYSAGNNNTFTRCTASFFLGTGFNLPAGLACIVDRCLATNCTANGFIGNGNNVSFFNNSASNNGVNYTNLGTNSGDAVALKGAITVGTNLAQQLP